CAQPGAAQTDDHSGSVRLGIYIDVYRCSEVWGETGLAHRRHPLRSRVRRVSARRCSGAGAPGAEVRSGPPAPGSPAVARRAPGASPGAPWGALQRGAGFGACSMAPWQVPRLGVEGGPSSMVKEGRRGVSARVCVDGRTAHVENFTESFSEGSQSIHREASMSNRIPPGLRLALLSGTEPESRLEEGALVCPELGQSMIFGTGEIGRAHV